MNDILTFEEYVSEQDQSSKSVTRLEATIAICPAIIGSTKVQVLSGNGSLLATDADTEIRRCICAGKNPIT